MKNFYKTFFVSVLCIFLIGIVFLFAMNIFFSYKSFEKSTETYAKEYSKAKYFYLNNFFENEIQNIQILSEMNFSKNVFNKEKEIDENRIFSESKKEIKIISKEIENYLIKNPELKLSELKNNSEFKNISISSFGKTGYFVLYEKDTSLILSHPNKDFENIKINNIPTSENFKKLVNEIKNYNNVYGEYFFYSNKKNITKFAYFYEIPVKTNDNKSLVLVSTIQKNDHEKIKNFDSGFFSFLKHMKKNRGYKDLIFIEENGDVIFSLENYNLYEVNPKNILFYAFENSALNNKTIIYGPYYENDNPTELSFLLISPIFNLGKKIGFIAVSFPADKLYEKIISNEIFINKKEFLINNNYFLITPIDNDTNSILIQEIYPYNSQDCFSSKKNENFILEFLDHKGEKSIGTSYYIEKAGLCYLVEFSRKDMNREAFNFLIKDSFLFFIFWGFFLIIIIGLSKYFGSKYSFKKKGKIKARQFLFFKDVSLFRYILIQLILIISYILILNYIFPNIFLSTIKNNSPDIISIFILGILLKKSYKIPLKFRKFYFLGVLIILIEKIIEIFMQQIEFFMGSGVLIKFWFFIILFLFLGIILLIKSVEGIITKWI